jgi:hypothetical protein
VREVAERSYEEEGSRRRDDAESKIAHETTDALTLSGHARTPSGCKSGDIKRTIIKKRWRLPLALALYYLLLLAAQHVRQLVFTHKLSQRQASVVLEARVVYL